MLQNLSLWRAMKCSSACTHSVGTRTFWFLLLEPLNSLRHVLRKTSIGQTHWNATIFGVMSRNWTLAEYSGTINLYKYLSTIIHCGKSSISIPDSEKSPHLSDMFADVTFYHKVVTVNFPSPYSCRHVKPNQKLLHGSSLLVSDSVVRKTYVNGEENI